MGLVISAVLVSGVAAGAAGDFVPGTAAAIAIAAAAIWIAAPGCARCRVGLAIVCLFSGAAWHGASARTRALRPPLVAWFDALTPGETRAADVVELDGRLLDDAAGVDGGVRLAIDVLRVRHEGTWHDLTGRVQAIVAGELARGQVDAWTAGRSIRAPATLRRSQVWRNFGGPSERWQQVQRRFDLAASVKSGALVTVVPGPVWHEMAARLRQHVRAAIGRVVGPKDRTAAAIAVAILIGDRASLDAGLIERLQIAGTYHVIAISGGNVALLTALCFFALRTFLRKARVVAVLTIAAVLVYGWVVGGQPSVVRAVIAATLFLAASAAGLRPRALHAFATVGALLAIADPLMTLDVGAWLSFGATLGILVCAARLTGAFGAATSSWIRRRAVSALLRVVAGLVAATVAAELVLWPISAAVFNRVSLAGLVLNVAAIPAMAVVQCAGLALIALETLSPIADAMACAVVVGTRILLGSARLVEWAPFVAWRVPPVPIWWMVFYFAALATVLSCRERRPRAVAALAAAVALVVILWSPGVVRGEGAPGMLRVTVIDVGQGDALLVQLPSGHTLLVDAGGAAGTFDVGARVVTPAVWAQRTSRIDWLAISHPDQDHAGGAPSVIGDLRPREIWEGIPVPANALRASIREDAADRGAIWRELRTGARLEAGGVELDVLHPPPPDWERQRVRNDDSLVLRLRYGDVEFLLTGDAGAEFESSPAALSGGSAAPIRVLKAAHHGSRSSSSQRFVEAYAPQVVVISAGRGNLFGHPARDVLNRFDAVGAEVFRTDLDGAITIETDGRAVHVRAYTGRTWTVAVLRPS